MIMSMTKRFREREKKVQKGCHLIIMTQKSMHQSPSPGLITQDVNETEERELMTAVSSVRQTKQVIG